MLHGDLCENFKKHLLGVQALGEAFTTSYVEVQMEQWQSYSRHLSQWELDNTLDCWNWVSKSIACLIRDVANMLEIERAC